MKTENWLKRKYPNIGDIIMKIFGEDNVRIYMKNDKYKPAILIKDTEYNKKGTLFLVKKSGHMIEERVWDGTYDIYGIFYCGEGKKITGSGYLHTYMYEEYYVLLNDALSEDSE